MIEKTKATFLSSEGKQNIQYTRWIPQAEVRGILLIAHGMAEYIDRYDQFANAAAELGWAVYGNDHLGHGGTAPDEQQLGFFAEQNGAAHVINDIHNLRQIAAGDYPGRPILLLGHSMGSFIARAFCGLYPDDLSGLIIMGSGGRNPTLGLGIAISRMIKGLYGGHVRSPFLDTLAFGTYCKKIENPRTKFDWLNTDSEKVDRYIADPLCGYMFTVSGFCDLFNLTRLATQKDWTKNIPVNLPILIVSGQEDPVGAYGAGPQETYADLHERGCESISLILYEGMRHEILNERDRQNVYDDIFAWMDSVTGGSGEADGEQT